MTARLDVTLEQSRALPWPVADGSVDAVHCTNAFHRLTARERIAFMEEAWRVLKPGGKLEIVVPHARSETPAALETAWPPLVEKSFLYFNAEERREMAVPHYGIHCDFELEVGLELAPEWFRRNDAERHHAAQHFHGAIVSMTAFMTKR